MTPEETEPISNLKLPVAAIIRQLLNDKDTSTRAEILSGLDVDEFISQRVDIYLSELSKALHAGADEIGAKEIALSEATDDLQ